MHNVLQFCALAVSTCIGKYHIYRHINLCGFEVIKKCQSVKQVLSERTITVSVFQMDLPNLARRYNDMCRTIQLGERLIAQYH